MNENDNLFAPRFTIKDVTIHKKERIFKRYFAIDRYLVSYKRFDGTESRIVDREIFERDADAVAVLAWDKKTDEIALIEQARVLKKEETEVKLLRVANVKEQLETTYKDRRDKIERKLIKTEKSLTDLVGNYKDSSIMGIIGNTIVNNEEL